MNRRNFLGSLGTMFAGVSSAKSLFAPHSANTNNPAANAIGKHEVVNPLDVKITIKPVMTNIIHSGAWEGPCRKTLVTPEEEKVQVAERFGRWMKRIEDNKLNLDENNVTILEPVNINFSDDFVVSEEELNKLKSDCKETDAYFVAPVGSSISGFNIAKHYNKPIILSGLGCRSVDIAAYTRNQGYEAYVAANNDELKKLVSLLRVRKVFTGTNVLFPTDWGLPAVCSIGSIYDFCGLEDTLGVKVKKVTYKEVSEEMNSVIKDRDEQNGAEELAGKLIMGAQKSFLDKKYVISSALFYQTVRNLMNRYNCNAFTIECFELCASKLADNWNITPCLIHTLLKDEGYAASCEGDLGALLGMRLLMSVSNKSSHMGNSDPETDDSFHINHSVPGIKMNGYNKPGLPYQLGHFVESGWGTKAVVNFLDSDERNVTVARIDPTASRLVVLKGELTGARGWSDKNILGCTVYAVIKPSHGNVIDFMKSRADYGNHLPWVYGDYSEELQQLGQMLKMKVEVFG